MEALHYYNVHSEQDLSVIKKGSILTGLMLSSFIYYFTENFLGAQDIYISEVESSIEDGPQSRWPPHRILMTIPTDCSAGRMGKRWPISILWHQ